MPTSLPPLKISFVFNTDPVPVRKINDTELDLMLQEIARVVNLQLAQLNTVFRSDDTLTDAIIRLRNLHPEVLASMKDGGGFPIAWISARTIAQLPAPSLAQNGTMALVTDAYGGATLAYCDQAANEWLRAYDRLPVWKAPDFAGRRMAIGVPLYSYPPSVWSTYIALGMPDIGIAILNPNSGPGTSPDPGYVTAYAALLAKGTRVLGYVHTSYGTRPIAEVKAEIDTYLLFYPKVSGIFFDEGGDEGSPAADDPTFLYYAELWNYVLTTMPYPQQFVALNPGATIAERFMTISSAIILFEDIADNYLTHENPEWLIDYDRRRIWHLMHSVASAAQMRNLFDRARELGVGTVYITSDVLPNPWDALSGYHTEQLAKLAETDDAFAVIDVPGRASEWWASESTLTAIAHGVVNAVLNNDPGANGYTAGQELAVVGGTGTAAVIRVMAVDVLGGPTRIAWTPGDYSVSPSTSQDFGSGFKVTLTIAATNIVTALPDLAAIPNDLTTTGQSRPFTVSGPGVDTAARFTGIQKLYTPAAWHDQRAIGGRTMWMVAKSYLVDSVLMAGNSNEWGIYCAAPGLSVSYQAGSFQGGSADITGEWAIIVAIFDAVTGRHQLRVNGTIVSSVSPGAGGDLPTVVAIGDYADGGATPTGNAAHADIVAAGVYNRAITDTELANLEAALAARTSIVLG
jgi:hypothetical protein